MANGICRRLTVTYTPQQNGVAERKNWTLVEMARCLLLQSNLDDSFWAEAIATANHIRNRCITRRLDGKTPYELWKGKLPNLHYLRTFGTRTFVLNKFPGKGKFAARSNEGIFIGYSEQAKAYRVWLTAERKVVTTRDVKFVEKPVKNLKDTILTSNENIKVENKLVILNDTDFVPKKISQEIEIGPYVTRAVEIPEIFEINLNFEGLIRARELEVTPDKIRERPDDIDAVRELQHEHLEIRILSGRPRIIRTGNRGRPKKSIGWSQHGRRTRP